MGKKQEVKTWIEEQEDNGKARRQIRKREKKPTFYKGKD